MYNPVTTMQKQQRYVTVQKPITRTVMQPRSVTVMASQVQTSMVPETYTETVPVTTTRQVVEEQGGYVTQAIPVTTTVSAGCAPAAGCGVAGGLFSRCTGGIGCGHKCGHRCGGSCSLCGGYAAGEYTTQTSCTYTQVYVSRPVVRSVPETTYVNQTRTVWFPCRRSFRCPRPRPRWFR